jgi:hypothetical protein
MVLGALLCSFRWPWVQANRKCLVRDILTCSRKWSLSDHPNFDTGSNYAGWSDV